MVSQNGVGELRLEMAWCSSLSVEFCDREAEITRLSVSRKKRCQFIEDKIKKRTSKGCGVSI